MRNGDCGIPRKNKSLCVFQEDTMKRVVFLIQGMMIILSIFFLCQQSLAGVAIEQVVRDMEERASVVFLYFSENQFLLVFRH